MILPILVFEVIFVAQCFQQGLVVRLERRQRFLGGFGVWGLGFGVKGLGARCYALGVM